MPLAELPMATMRRAKLTRSKQHEAAERVVTNSTETKLSTGAAHAANSAGGQSDLGRDSDLSQNGSNQNGYGSDSLDARVLLANAQISRL